MPRLDDAFAALRADLIHDDGPQISTMRNYRFAILPYPPEKEFDLRRRIQELVAELQSSGWVVKTISLKKLLLDRIRGLGRDGEDIIPRMIEMERRAAGVARERGLNYLRDKICREIEGPDGIAADVCAAIDEFTKAHPDKADRTLVFVGRAGALYPFFRTSSLLKHIDGRTGSVPVILLYPGTREGETALSFMGETPADGDYRPRIYP